MKLPIGVTIEDNPQGGFSVYYTTLDGSNQSAKVNSIGAISTDKGGPVGNNKADGKLNSDFEDLEGLGAIGNKIYAISESAFGGGVGDPGVVVTRPDRTQATNTVKNLQNKGFIVRDGNDVGFDTLNQNVGYAIGGINKPNSPGASPGTTIGSQLYKVIKLSSISPDVQKIGNLNNEFADGLSIVNNKVAVVSDWKTVDGDNDELAIINLNNGKFLQTVKVDFLDKNGDPIKGLEAIKGNSGLDLTPGKATGSLNIKTKNGKFDSFVLNQDGTFKMKGNLNGALFAIEDKTNDIFVAIDSSTKTNGKITKSFGSFDVIKRTGADVRLIDDINFVEINDGGLPESGNGEFEGLAVIHLSQSEFNSFNFETFGEPEII